MEYMVLCYEGEQPAQPYHELIRGGLKRYLFTLEEATDIANDLYTQYGVFGEEYKIIKLEEVSK